MPNTPVVDLDHIPTLEELRAAFKENDFLTRKLCDNDYEHLTEEDEEELEVIELLKKEIRQDWDPLAREMGMKVSAEYCGKDHPLMVLQENAASVIATTAVDLWNNHTVELFQAVDSILEQYEANPDVPVPVQARTMMRKGIRKTMEVMQYEEIASILNKQPAHEDFNGQIYENFRKKDFDRKWGHTRTATKVESLDALEQQVEQGTKKVNVSDARVNVETDALAILGKQQFWASLSEQDKLLVQLRLDGHTMSEIASKLGYKTHSAVAKRLQRLRGQFEEVI